MSPLFYFIFQRSYTNGQQIREKVLNITNNWEIQIKTTMKYHLIPVRMADIKKMRLVPLSGVGEGIEKREPYKVYNVY